MKLKLLFKAALLSGVCLLFSCEKSNSSCGGNDPMNDLPWLEQEIGRLSSLNQCYNVSRSTYEKQTVFIVSNCEPNINSVPLLYNCDGNVLNLSATNYQNLKFTGSIELIWKSN
ncbi:MAG: hypothetical protein Q7U83_08420 [Daejeonella sp.]|nr:hypothetical protein [Daejeonella sp.]